MKRAWERPKRWVWVTAFLAVLNAALLTGIVGDPEFPKFGHGPAYGPDYILEVEDVPASSMEEANVEEVGMRQYAVFTEWMLVDAWVDGDYEIEEYQQFKVYKDGDRTVQTVATPEYQYLRYWIGE